jgi:hypothetical protein
MGVFVLTSLRLKLDGVRWFSWVIGWAFCIGFPANVSPFIEHTTDRWQEQGTVPGQSATDWLNQHVEDETVALLFLWTGAELEVPYVLSSVEDHTPVRHWILQYGDGSLQELKARGVRWVAVGPHTFHRSAYDFLSDADFDSQWITPMNTLERLLSHEARWITKQGGVDIYYLP